MTIWLVRSTPTRTTGAVDPSAGIRMVPLVGHGPASAEGVHWMPPPGFVNAGHEGGPAEGKTGRGVSSVTTACGAGVATTRVAWTAILFGAPMTSPNAQSETPAAETPIVTSVLSGGSRISPLG